MRPALVSPAFAILLCTAAAAAASPELELRAAGAAIAGAEQAGASREAPAELERAREKMALAQRWLAARDYKPVRWLAEQAEVDAELAQVKATRLVVEKLRSDALQARLLAPHLAQSGRQ